MLFKSVKILGGKDTTLLNFQCGQVHKFAYNTLLSQLIRSCKETNFISNSPTELGKSESFKAELGRLSDMLGRDQHRLRLLYLHEAVRPASEPHTHSYLHRLYISCCSLVRKPAFYINVCKSSQL